MSEEVETPVPSGIMTVAGGPVTVTETPEPEPVEGAQGAGPGKHPPSQPTPERPTHVEIAAGAYKLYLGNTLAGEPNDEHDNWYRSETRLWRRYIHGLDRTQPRAADEDEG